MRRLSLLLFLLLLVSVAAATAADFPLRATYPDLTPISTADLSAAYDRAVIVDVRSPIEFDVIHINKALNLPVSQGDFLASLEKARAKNGPAPLAFYCNGITCAKSYKACDAAREAGFGNIFVYDEGIFAWAQAEPAKTTLMGTTPARADKLIAKEALQARMLPFAEFKKQAADPGAMVVDVREPWQRAKNPELPQNSLLDLAGVRNVPLDRLVPLLQQGKFKDQHLLIADAVGKQVQWLQYFLEQYGYTDYVFLKNGVKGAAEAGGTR